MVLAITVLQITNTVLVLFFLFLLFKYVETKWSYKISKPYAWDEAVRKKTVSKKLIKIERFYRDKVRFYTLWFQVERLKKEGIHGAFAEVGVYKGETARVLHAMDPSRPLHLFDTFTGFDKNDLDVEKLDSSALVDFSDTSLEYVKTFIDGNENVLFHPGYFPASAKNLPEAVYALVHLDADLYQPTLAALTYFYPLVAPGGILLIHDYNHNWNGVSQAVTEFKSSIPEALTEIADWQGSVMLIRNQPAAQA
jgi:O-methyltransferase